MAMLHTLMTQHGESARPSFRAQTSEDFRSSGFQITIPIPGLIFYKIDSANQALMKPGMEKRLSAAWAVAPSNKSLLLISKSGQSGKEGKISPGDGERSEGRGLELSNFEDSFDRLCLRYSNAEMRIMKRKF